MAPLPGALWSYDTWTVGAGLYGHWRPWRHSASWLKGLNASGSARWWPNVATSLEGDVRRYEDALGQQRVHEALNIGLSNTPLVLNVSLGYAVAF